MRSNTKEFIEKATKIHGDKYDYSQVDYETNRIKITVLCPRHGTFEQTPNDHLAGKGCRECKRQTLAILRSSDLAKFIQKAYDVHGKQYDYSKVHYAGSHNKITIVCPTHGEFSQTATDHLSGKGCKTCGIRRASKSRRLTTEEFVTRARKVHGNKYDYHKSLYRTMHDKVTITCNKHGDFCQTPLNHIFDSNGCPRCKESKGEIRIRKFLEFHYLTFHSQYRIDTCKYKKTLPFDFMVELRSDAFFIEFHGQQHFYKATGRWRRCNLDEIQKRDKIKELWCQNNNMPLLVIPYTQYDLIEDKLFNFLGL